jgi:glycine/D-amino acid oxidase-like deaminating enzyme
MNDPQTYDVAIIGGGLAGLSAAIQFRRSGHSVLLVEKEAYPFHKVCGEYISMESAGYLSGLGIDTGDLNLPLITELMLNGIDADQSKWKLFSNEASFGRIWHQPLSIGSPAFFNCHIGRCCHFPAIQS